MAKINQTKEIGTQVSQNKDRRTWVLIFILQNMII